MNGQEKLNSVAFVVSMVVVICLAITLSILFFLYSFYKNKHIKYGHEDNKIDKEIKKKYHRVIEEYVNTTPKLVPKYYYDLTFKDQNVKNYNKKVEYVQVVEESTPVKKEVLKQKEKNKSLLILLRVVFGLFYVVFISLIIVAGSFKLNDQHFFFNNQTLLTIQTGSMEEKNKENTYLTEFNLNNQIEQYSLISLSKINKEEDIKLYDVVGYKYENITIVHRVIKIHKNPSDNITYYTLRGDSNRESFSFEIGLTFNDLVGKYNGFQNYGLGLTLLYMQSNIGIIALSASLLFLFTSNYSEERINKAYDDRIFILVNELDKKMYEEAKKRCSVKRK